MSAAAELAEARVNLIAATIAWHEGKLSDHRLHVAAERYKTLRDAYLDALWSKT